MAANEYNLLEPLFLYLSEQTGFLVDQIRYIVLMFMSYPLALILRYVLHPDHTPLYVRHLYSLLVGVVMGLFCFGWGQMGILLFIIGVSYLLLIYLPPSHTQWYSMLWAMGSIATAHVYRVATDYGGFHLDFTGPLMILVQKITLAAYALHDGVAREDSQLNKDQRQQKLLSPLGPLEYLSYMFNFHTFLAGPSCTAKEYLMFIDGSNLRPSPGKKSQGEPSAVFPIFSKLFQSLASLTMFIVFTWYVDNDLVMEPHHRQPFRLLLNYINSLRLRGRYYFIWLLSESICNCAGLGFSGYDEHGQPKWDLMSNINIWQIECATNLRVVALYWNAVTGLWLRRCVYERVPYANTLATFAVSAWWHGCYPGYYFCFIYFGIATEAARKMRRLLRHHFQGNAGLRVGYDMGTWLVTHLCVDYGVLCLDMMWASKSITYWSYYYFIPIITVTVVAVFFPTGKGHRSKVQAQVEKPQEQAELTNPKIKSE